MTKQAINEVISNGMGIWAKDGCCTGLDEAECMKHGMCRDCRLWSRAEDFFTPDGFFMMMEWRYGQPGAHDYLEFVNVMMVKNPEEWPKRLALHLASHFAGEKVEVTE